MGIALSCRRKSTKPPISISAPISTTGIATDSRLPLNPLTMTQAEVQASTAVAVYCASSYGQQEAFRHAARSLGNALADAGRPLVYGGGSKGIMGIVSGAALAKGGKVTGVVPFAMVAAGGEREKKAKATLEALIALDESGRENVNTIVVDSMHERKMEMARRSCGFITLPGGFGTFEEVLEVITWSQLGIHNKPIIIVNVLGFFNPLRDLIRNGVREGFIHEQSQKLVEFLDGPTNHSEHETFDWGKAALQALDRWEAVGLVRPYDWTKRGSGDVAQGEELSAA